MSSQHPEYIMTLVTFIVHLVADPYQSRQRRGPLNCRSVCAANSLEAIVRQETSVACVVNSLYLRLADASKQRIVSPGS